MTEITSRTRAGIAAWISAWVRRCQRELSDRMHAAGDERARQHGWEITKNTGRLGFGAHSYRDLRFGDQRQVWAETKMLRTAEWFGEGQADPGPTDPIVGNKAEDYEADREMGE